MVVRGEERGGFGEGEREEEGEREAGRGGRRDVGWGCALGI